MNAAFCFAFLAGRSKSGTKRELIEQSLSRSITPGIRFVFTTFLINVHFSVHLFISGQFGSFDGHGDHAAASVLTWFTEALFEVRHC